MRSTENICLFLHNRILCRIRRLHNFQLLNALFLITSLLVDPLDGFDAILLCLGISTDNTTVSSHLSLLVLDVCQWPLRGNGIFVFKDEDIFVLSEQSVDILECTVGCLGVEKIYDWYKGRIEDSPDYIEFPVESLDPNGGNFNHLNSTTVSLSTTGIGVMPCSPCS